MKSIKYYIKSAELRFMSWIAPRWLSSPKSIDPIGINNTLVKDWEFDLKYYHSFHYYRFHQDIKSIYAWNEAGYPFNYLECPKDYTNPLTTAQYLLMLTVQEGFWKNKGMQSEFVKIAEYLDQLAQWEGSYLVWRIGKSVPRFKTPENFSSGIIQACCLSVYLRWYMIAPEDVIKSKIESIYQSLQYPIDQGGFFTYSEEQLPWLEEYPSERPVQVLNGHLYGVVAAYEYAHAMQQGFEFADHLLEAFLASYQKFRFGPYLKYCRYYPMLCNVTYQLLHDQQLIHLTQLTGRTWIFDLQNEWKQNYSRSYCLKQLGIVAGEKNNKFIAGNGPNSWRSPSLLR